MKAAGSPLILHGHFNLKPAALLHALPSRASGDQASCSEDREEQLPTGLWPPSPPACLACTRFSLSSCGMHVGCSEPHSTGCLPQHPCILIFPSLRSKYSVSLTGKESLPLTPCPSVLIHSQSCPRRCLHVLLPCASSRVPSTGRLVSDTEPAFLALPLQSPLWPPCWIHGAQLNICVTCLCVPNGSCQLAPPVPLSHGCRRPLSAGGHLPCPSGHFSDFPASSI